MRIMIDTNIFISIYLFPNPPMRKLVDTITDHHTIVLPFKNFTHPEKVA